MLLGLITGFIVAGINMPLAHFIASKTNSAVIFSLIYFPLGLISVVLGFVLLSLFLTFSAQIYWFVGLMAYASIAAENLGNKRLDWAIAAEKAHMGSKDLEAFSKTLPGKVINGAASGGTNNALSYPLKNDTDPKNKLSLKWNDKMSPGGFVATTVGGTTISAVTPFVGNAKIGENVSAGLENIRGKETPVLSAVENWTTDFAVNRGVDYASGAANYALKTPLSDWKNDD